MTPKIAPIIPNRINIPRQLIRAIKRTIKIGATTLAILGPKETIDDAKPLLLGLKCSWITLVAIIKKELLQCQVRFES